MVQIAVLLLAVVISSAQALSFYSRHHTIECGARINAEGSYRLPKHEMCTINVEVPEEQAVQITVSGKEFRCRHHASDLMIVSSETKTPVFPCLDRAGGAVFVGGESEYMINVRELPAGTHIGVSYYSTHFECGDSVPFDVVGIPLTMSYTRTEKPCSLVLPGRARAAVESVEGSGVCIQIKQGLRLGDFPLHSKKVCQKGKEDEMLSYDVFCSIGEMIVESESEATIHFRIEAPSADQLDSYRIESFACSGRLID
ncbi:unnamed protein product [Cylicocyclus nassatus]|uniref:Uncharacterized protein n=1 Tax=Cylicocyclus nassatus TaxID=53992 RepID=A0AA36MHC4_CYLNA|nr:unnamed protein product [Cylicocyclus nassatus]